MKNIVIFFDGTGNTFHRADNHNERTHIRRCFDLIGADHHSRHEVPNTNKQGIRTLRLQIDSSTQLSVDALYIEGIESLLPQVLGQGVISRVEAAIQYLHDTFIPGDAISIYGFSRGAASGLLFAKYIQENSEKLIDGGQLPNIQDWIDSGPHYGKGMRAPLIQNVTLIDTVYSTVEFSLNKNAWISDVYGMAKSVHHFVSKHEDRGSFVPLISDAGNRRDRENYMKFSQVTLDGSHSDIGGLYSDSLLGAPILQHILMEFENLQVPFNIPAVKACFDSMSKIKLRLESTKPGLTPWRIGSAISFLAETLMKVPGVKNSKKAQYLLKNGRISDREAEHHFKVTGVNSRLCDPSNGDAYSYFGKHFLIPYDIVKRKVVECIDNGYLSLDYFNFSDVPGHIQFYDISLDRLEVQTMGHFYFDQVDMRVEQTLLHNQISQDAYSKIDDHKVKHFKKRSLTDKLSNSKLYSTEGVANLSNGLIGDKITRDLFATTNIGVLMRIREDLLSSGELKKSDALLEMISKTFHLPYATLNQVVLDPLFSFRGIPAALKKEPKNSCRKMSF